MSGGRLTVTGMENQTGVCPRCDQVVPMRHNGKAHGANEYTNPWEFVEHQRDDLRGGQLVGAEPCPGSGRNYATARSSF